MKLNNLQKDLIDQIQDELMRTGLVELREGSELDDLETIQDAIESAVIDFEISEKKVAKDIMTKIGDALAGFSDCDLEDSDGVVSSTMFSQVGLEIIFNYRERVLEITNDNDIKLVFTETSKELCALKELFYFII